MPIVRVQIIRGANPRCVEQTMRPGVAENIDSNDYCIRPISTNDLNTTDFQGIPFRVITNSHVNIELQSIPNMGFYKDIKITDKDENYIWREAM